MFEITEREENGVRQYTLRDTQSGTCAVIIPAQCATVNQFAVMHNGAPVNVIDGYASQHEFSQELEELGFKGCKLSPFVCRLADGKYTFASQEYRVEKSLPAKHALHGLLYDKAFDVLETHQSQTEASIRMQYAYRGDDPGYPFDYDCVVKWTLQADNRLTVETSCINRDSGLIPMQDGWHPYFTFGKPLDELQLEFQAREVVEFNDELVPTGERSEYTRFSALEPLGNQEFDNCFSLNFDTCMPLCVLRDPQSRLQLEIHPHQSYPYLQIYTPPHRRSIAIENISGAPNAFNNGMGVQTLESGETAHYKTTYKITSLA